MPKSYTPDAKLNINIFNLAVGWKFRMVKNFLVTTEIIYRFDKKAKHMSPNKLGQLYHSDHIVGVFP